MQFLQELKIQKENEGSSTGAKWIQSKGEMISSFSPVDNQLIGAVVSTDQAAYEQVISTAQNGPFVYFFTGGLNILLVSVVILSVGFSIWSEINTKRQS